jgi:hypothetical protein
MGPTGGWIKENVRYMEMGGEGGKINCKFNVESHIGMKLVLLIIILHYN